MAFNPFHGFRKHQKVVFAALTIICMLTFVLAGSGSLGGRGDFFDWVTTSFGGEGKWPAIARLYGKKVTQLDIVTLRDEREIANAYMENALSLATRNIMQEISKSGDKLGPIQQQIQQMLQFASIPGFYQQSRTQLLSTAIKLQGEGKKEEALLVSQLVTVLDRQVNRRPGEAYFGGSFGVEGLLDFAIWKQQADRLGIQLTGTDVDAEVRRETLGRLTPEDARELTRRLTRNRRIPINFQNLVSALNDEFRVRMAQAAMLGYEAGRPSHIPAPVTPYEFWEYFRRNRTEVSVTVLPLRVEDFVAEVKDEPTAGELDELFKKHKDQEYTPESPTPGFRQPRRMGVEWVAARADSPHYQRAADVAMAALEATMPLALQGKVLDEYDFMKRTHFKEPAWTESWSGWQFPLHESSLHGPVTIASTVGQFLGASGTQTAVLTAVTALDATAVTKEILDRLRLGSTMILLASSDLPFLAAASAFESTPRDEYRPLQTVRHRVLQRVRETFAQDLVISALNTVKKELDAKKKQPEEAAKYIAEAIKQHALKHGATSEPRDRFNLGADKGLDPLKDAYLRVRLQQDPKAKQFATMFFTPAKVFEAERWPMDQYQGAGSDWQSSSEPFLYWKTSDKPAYEPTFAEVKEAVRDAWRFEKARTLAEARAKEIETKVQKAKGTPEPVLTEESKHPERLFSLYLISRLQRSRSALFGSRQYEAYRVPEDKIEYPPAEFIEKVLGLKEKGDVVVLQDRPNRFYYVAALINRIEPSMQEFYLSYNESGPGALQRDTLLDLFEQEQRQKYAQEFVEQLRAEAHLHIEADAKKHMEDRDTGD